MSDQELVQGWKAKAFAALAEYYKLCEERATFEARVVAATEVCKRAGVSFSWDNEPENLPTTRDAVSCSCGTIIPLTYDNEQLYRAGGRLNCRPCREKAAAAAKHDAALEGRILPT